MAHKTINDVAKAAGVAIKTVSRVLNDEPNVRDETRARVQAVVKALDYHPSISARSLAGRRSFLIGLVYGNPSANYIVDVQHGTMACCRQQRFQLLSRQSGSTQGEELSKEVLGLVAQTRIDGIVLTPPLSESGELIKALDRRGVPFVRISPNDVPHSSPCVDMDDEGAAHEMTEYLIGLGHRRIGFVTGHPQHYASKQRLKGYKSALRKHRLPFQPEYVKPGSFVFDSGMESGRQLLTLPQRPTAIFASNDDMAAGVTMAAHEMGIAVPAQLSISGFDDTYIARAIWPRLTTVHQPSYEMAYRATGLLLQMLRTRKAPAPIRLPYTLVCRESTGPVSPGEAR